MGKLSDSEIHQICTARRQGRAIKEIAREYSVDPATVRYHVGRHGVTPGTDAPVGGLVTVEHTGDVRPEAMMKLYGLSPDKWLPTRFNISIGRHGPRGSLSCKRIMTETLEAAILKFVRQNVRPLPKPKAVPRRKPGDFMVAWGLWDMHIGSYAWNTEVGADWDVDMACRRVVNSVDDMVVELNPYKVDCVYMPIGNDFLHFDSNRMQTTFGEHHMDCDTRFARVYQAGLYSLSYMIERAAGICNDVRILYIPGNHDMSTSFTLCAALNERFRHDPRVTVDLQANPRKYTLYGGTLLGFGHGSVPDAQMKLIFAEEAHDLWSQSSYREMQIGHTHQRKAKEVPGLIPLNGLTVRTNPTLCNNDFWHHSKALIGESMRSVEAWRYDRRGYRGSHVTWARDDDHQVAAKIIKKAGG